MIRSLPECLAICCGSCGLSSESREEGMPSEREVAQKTLQYAFQAVDIQAVRGIPSGWLDRKKRDKAIRKEQRRVERQVESQVIKHYGVSPIVWYLGLSALGAMLSWVVQKVMDWFWVRWDRDSGFESSILMMRGATA